MEYWTPIGISTPWSLEVVASLALRFLDHNTALVAGKLSGEDSNGRAKYDLQPVDEVVNRAFAIAEEFVRVAESKNLIRTNTREEILEIEGQIEDFRLDLSGRKYKTRPINNLKEVK